MARVIIRPTAELDLLDAFEYSEIIEPGLGIRFNDNVERLIRQLESLPFSYPLYYRESRRAVIRQSPYLLYHTSTEQLVYVVACFSAHRDPRWVRRRLASRGGA